MLCPCFHDQADLESCPTEEVLLIGDPNKVYGEQWYFTYTAEAFESQLVLQKAGEVEEQARLEAEAEVSISPHAIPLCLFRRSACETGTATPVGSSPWSG